MAIIQQESFRQFKKCKTPTVIIYFLPAPISLSWSHGWLCQAQVQDNLMGPGSHSCLVTWPWAELGRDTPGSDWTSLFSWQLERPTKQMREAEERLKAIPQFCFPDAKDWLPVSEYNRWVLQSSSAHWSDAGMECTATASASLMPN